MDPLSALSVAATVVQFIDFSSKILNGAREIHNSDSGMTSENASLRLIVADLQNLSSNLGSVNFQPGWQRNSDQIALQDLANQCQKFSEELSAILEKLSSRDVKSRTESLRVLMQSVRHQKQVRNLQKRLETCRGQLVARIMPI